MKPCTQPQRQTIPTKPSSVLKRTKRRVGELASRNLWTRYALLAPYLGLRALISAITGKTTSGATHAESSIDEAVNYITGVFDDYKLLAGGNKFAGNVAEIGTGDSCGVGLLFLADGCERVDLIDRFYTPRDETHQREINKRLLQRRPELLKHRRDADLSESSFTNLFRHYGRNAAAEVFFKQRTEYYSVIVSRAVFEHLYDPLAALSSAIQALRPGGTMVHGVDCRDHGLFSHHFDDLAFLRFPKTLYSPFTWNGGPNRVRLSAYRKALDNEPVEYEIYPIQLAGVTESIPLPTRLPDVDPRLLEASKAYVDQVRSRLASPFREMGDEDLMVQGFFVLARKLLTVRTEMPRL